MLQEISEIHSRITDLLLKNYWKTADYNFYQCFVFMLIYLIAIPIEFISAAKQYSLIDRTTTVILFVLYSLPNFWVATLAIIFLCNVEYLKIFPTSGIKPKILLHWTSLGKFKIFYALFPACNNFKSGKFCIFSRQMRSSMLEVIRQDYIRTARAKGLSERKVVLKHALRNSLIPIITLVGDFYRLWLWKCYNWNNFSIRNRTTCISGNTWQGLSYDNGRACARFHFNSCRNSPCGYSLFFCWSNELHLQKRSLNLNDWKKKKKKLKVYRNPTVLQSADRITAGSRCILLVACKTSVQKNKLAMISMYIVIFLIFLALTVDFLASSKPLYAVYKGETYFPVIKDYLNSAGIDKWSSDMINLNWKEVDNQGKLESVIWTPVTWFKRNWSCKQLKST